MSDEKKLTVDQIQVPERMVTASATPLWKGNLVHRDDCRAILASALLWLAENPIVPSDEQADQLWHHPKTLHGDEHYAKAMARQWQQIMFIRTDTRTDEQKAIAILGTIVDFIDKEGPASREWLPISNAAEEARTLLEKLTAKARG